MKKILITVLCIVSTGFFVYGILLFSIGNHEKDQRLIDYSTTASKKEETDEEMLVLNGQQYFVSLRSDLLEEPTVVEATDETAEETATFLSQRVLSEQTDTDFDYKAISEGKFDSIVGTWADGTNHVLQFSTKKVTIPAEATLSDYSYGSGDELMGVLTTEDGKKITLRFYPAGVLMPSDAFHLTTEDPSDYNRDRIVATIIDTLDYDSVANFATRVFYRISTDNPLAEEEAKASEEEAKKSSSESSESSSTEESSSQETTTEQATEQVTEVPVENTAEVTTEVPVETVDQYTTEEYIVQ